MSIPDRPYIWSLRSAGAESPHCQYLENTVARYSSPSPGMRAFKDSEEMSCLRERPSFSRPMVLGELHQIA